MLSNDRTRSGYSITLTNSGRINLPKHSSHALRLAANHTRLRWLTNRTTGKLVWTCLIIQTPPLIFSIEDVRFFSIGQLPTVDSPPQADIFCGQNEVIHITLFLVYHSQFVH